MAWTAPATWSVAEIVTASKMNAHIRDNLNYLKGNAGAVTIVDSLLIQKASGSSSLGLQIPANTTYGQFIFNDQAGTQAAYLGFIGSSAGLGARDDTVELGTVAKDLTFRAGAGGASEYMRMLTASGNLGIGTAAPQGKLHGYDTIGGFMHWKYDGVDGTARTVIPDGAGDVLYCLSGLFQFRTSAGVLSVASNIGNLAPGVATDLYNSAGNILQLQVAANGSVTVQRTGGALTYKVNLWLMWM